MKQQAHSRQAANALALLACATPAAVFSTLQSQGSAATVAEITGTSATTSAPIAASPTDKLAAVAAGLTGLSKKPGKKEDVEFLIAYGQSVGTSMKAPTASTPASGAAVSGTHATPPPCSTSHAWSDQMNTPAAPIGIATALSDQMSALLNAATKLDQPPISDHSAFLQVTGMEQGLETLYSGFANDADMPDLTAASQADLQTRLDSLQD